MSSRMRIGLEMVPYLLIDDINKYEDGHGRPRMHISQSEPPDMNGTLYL